MYYSWAIQLDKGLINTLIEMSKNKYFGTTFYFSIYGLNDILSSFLFFYCFYESLKSHFKK